MYGMLMPFGGGDPIPLRKSEVVIGRRNCDIVLDYGNVSSKHCQLVLSNGYWYVQDLKSTNGVKVNGKKVTDQRLDPGATLAVAKHVFTVEYDPAANGATGPPPAQLLGEGDILSRSLMEKAGLQRPTFRRKDREDDLPIPMPEEVAAEPAKSTPSEDGHFVKKDYFSSLVFD